MIGQTMLACDMRMTMAMMIKLKMATTLLTYMVVAMTVQMAVV